MSMLDRRSLLKVALGAAAVAVTGASVASLTSGSAEAAPLAGATAGSAVLPESPVEQTQYRRRRRYWRRRRRVCVRRRRRVVCFWR